MKSKKSRLAVVGVLALAICLAVGLATGSAEAKKKKKAAGSVTISQTAPTTIPAKSSATVNDTMVSIPLTVGKKAKGKVVGWDSLTVTSTFSSSTTPGLGSLYGEITAPNGRTEQLNNPFASSFGGNTTSGPLTETPNSPFTACFPNAANPCPGGTSQFPEATVGPPYAGTVGNEALEGFGGVPAKGTWTVKVFNGSLVQGTLNSISITMTLKTAPV
jgi:small nuclear ribonucleoprotein (snRNP)-like protein